MTREKLIVILGPTAVGKGTVAARIRETHPEIHLSVSATTRAPRPGEVDGVHYYFVDDAEFDRLIADEQLLEYAVVHNKHRYGTPRRPDDRGQRSRSRADGPSGDCRRSSSRRAWAQNPGRANVEAG